MSAPLTSRGPMAIAAAILTGALSAVCLAFGVTHGGSVFIFLLFLTGIPAIPLFMVGLGGGSLAGLIAGISGCGALLLLVPSNYAFGYVFSCAIPAIVISTLALRYRTATDGKNYWYPEGYLLTALTIYPCILFLIIAIAAFSVEGGLLEVITRASHSALTETLAQIPSEQLSAEKVETAKILVDNVVKILPLIICTMWIFSMGMSIYIAQAVLRQQKWSLRPFFNLNDMHTPKWVTLLLIAAISGIFAAAPYDYIGTNLSVVLSVPFFFSGLSVVHGLAPMTGWPITTLVIFYILVFFMIWLTPLVILLGISDQWIDFRQRFAAHFNTSTPA